MGAHKSYLEEKATLEGQAITDLGRRILVRQALISHTGSVGAKALAQSLGVEEVTILRILKTRDHLWYERKGNIDLAARLCQFLRVDHSWLFHTIHYGDLGEVSFDLLRHQRWHMRAPKGVQCNTH